MAKKGGGNSIGSWAFLIGVILAVVLGFIGYSNSTLTVVYVLIGLVIGLLNISEKEARGFLMAGVVLIIASAFGGNALGSIRQLDGIMTALLSIFVPALIIVSIRSVFSMAKS